MAFPQIKSNIVQRYVDQTTQEIKEGNDRLEKIGMDGLPKFEENVMIWLGSMKEEIEEFQTPFFEITSLDGYSKCVHFKQVFSWNGCEGMIISQGWGDTWKTLYCGPATWLKMQVPGSGHEPESMKLQVNQPATGSGEYVDQAVPINETALGKLLVNIIRDIDRVHLEKQQRAERARFEALEIIEKGFLQLEDIPSIQQYLGRISQSNPDELARWNAAAKRRTLDITAAQKKKQEQEALIALEEKERARLAWEAGELFRPFTIYLLTLAIKFPDEQELHYTNVYVTASVPDETGWYTRVNRGQVIVNYRPESPIVSVERIEIDSADNPHAPNICRHVELYSKELTYIAEYALATPEGLG